MLNVQSGKNIATNKRHSKNDLIFAIILLIATLSTVFYVIQATRGSRIQAEEFGNSATFRTKSIGALTQGKSQVTIDVQHFTPWVNAVSSHDTNQADLFERPIQCGV